MPYLPRPLKALEEEAVKALYTVSHERKNI